MAIPVPPLELRRLVGPEDPAMFDNPSGEPVFADVPADRYESVFDFGCGCGRVARQMIQQAPRPQRYIGVDLNAALIDWCTENLSPHADGFEFHHHDVYSTTNPAGSRDPQPFPLADNAVTLGIAWSVFTHLTEPQADFYLGELSRALAPGGLAFTTWFLFEKSEYPMMQDFQNALFINPDDPTNAVIFDRQWLRSAAAGHGLRIARVLPPEVRGFQWIVYLEKSEAEEPHADFPVDAAPVGVARPPLSSERSATTGPVASLEAVEARPSRPGGSGAPCEAPDPRDPAPLSPEAIREQIARHDTWYHCIEVAPGIVTPGSRDSQHVLEDLERLGLPDDCLGKRALDIGCRDGFFSFELERRGAEVVAIDYAKPECTGFSIVAGLLGSRLRMETANVYELSAEAFGTFDLVLFLGVLYHLRHPLLALDRIRSVMRPGALLFMESLTATGLPEEPLWRFLPRDSFNDDHTNQWAPTLLGFRTAAEEALIEVTGSFERGDRGYIAGRAVRDDRLEFFRRIDGDSGIEL